jgi:AcrR family transcriptional regulator
MIPPTMPTRSQRADALRNRQHLLDVAQGVFEEMGVDAPLDVIARRAGVGIGTLYRHFPTRDELIEAIVSTDLERLAVLAEQLVADGGDDAVDQWLEGLVAHTVTYRGLAESLIAASGKGSVLGAACDRLHAAGGALVRRDQRRGTVRADIDPGDAIDMATAIAWLTEGDGDDQRRRRLLRAAVDGLRTSPIERAPAAARRGRARRRNTPPS